PTAGLAGLRLGLALAARGGLHEVPSLLDLMMTIRGGVFSARSATDRSKAGTIGWRFLRRSASAPSHEPIARCRCVRAPGKLHCAEELVVEQRKDASDPPFSIHRQSPKDRSSDEHRACAEPERDERARSGAHAAVEIDLRAIGDCLDDAGER